MERHDHLPSEERLRDLPLAEAPASIWASLEDSLARGEKPQNRFPVWQVALAAACAAAVGVVYWTGTRKPGPRLEVVRLQGTPSIGSEHIGGTGQIAKGQWLETDASSKALIQIGDIGTVQVDPNSRVRLLADRPEEHRLSLAQGKISARVFAPPRLFFVETASSTAVDLGCAYTMSVDPSGNGLLQVTLGWVSLERGGRESFVPAGASCRMRPKLGPGIPFFDDAPQPFQQALADLDIDRKALDRVLRDASVRDTLSLWNLLSRVDATDRTRVYDRMVQLAPLPNDISAEKVLQLDPEALQHWREELSSIW